MYILELVLDTRERTEYVAADTKALFQLIRVVERSDAVVAWKIQGYSPLDFGWAPPKEWSKCRVDHFEQEDYNS